MNEKFDTVLEEKKLIEEKKEACNSKIDSLFKKVRFHGKTLDGISKNHRILNKRLMEF